MNYTRLVLFIGVVLAAAISFAGNAKAELRIQDGETILFIGGMVRPQAYDYSGCVATGLKTIHPVSCIGDFNAYNALSREQLALFHALAGSKVRGFLKK
jgi:hypothetical protein